jgi:hypothetical protein
MVKKPVEAMLSYVQVDQSGSEKERGVCNVIEAISEMSHEWTLSEEGKSSTRQRTSPLLRGVSDPPIR